MSRASKGTLPGVQATEARHQLRATRLRAFAFKARCVLRFTGKSLTIQETLGNGAVITTAVWTLAPSCVTRRCRTSLIVSG